MQRRFFVHEGGNTAMKKVIELRNVTKQFDGETVLDSINLDIYDNEFLTLLGPSGCGKTTTLRMIGGFETPDQGDILFLGERINDIPPHKRNINTVFQRYALFPHLNVFENVAFPLREQKLPRDEIEQKVNEMLALVKLTGFERRNVTRLSGGQQQRVAIARALVSRPRVLLLDEPLAALDLKLRKDMQQELKNIQKATGITFVFVTHDQEEALSMSDTIVVMSEGRIQQIGTPQEVFNHPANLFVAGFIGMPQMNFYDAELVLEDGQYAVVLNGAKVALPEEKQAKLKANGAAAGPITLGVRPEHLILSGDEGSMIHGTVDVSEMMGSAVHLHVSACGSDTIMIVSTTELESTSAFTIGSPIAFTFNGVMAHLFDRNTQKNLEA